MIHVLGVPFDQNSSFLRGPALAPKVIRECYHSDSANYYTESGLNLHQHPGWKDLGDIVVPEDAHTAIASAVSKRVNDVGRLFSLGGDHSITYPIIKGFATRYPNLTIVHIDAHPDLYDDFEGNPHSHASPFARIMEQGLAKRLIQIGIRTMNQHNREQAKRFGVEVIEMKDWTDSRRLAIEGPAYLTFDIDAIDPGFAPGISHHEPGGFTTRQALSIIQNLPHQFVGADLVEFNPTRDVQGITGMLAAKLFKEILDLLVRSDR